MPKFYLSESQKLTDYLTGALEGLQKNKPKTEIAINCYACGGSGVQTNTDTFAMCTVCNGQGSVVVTS